MHSWGETNFDWKGLDDAGAFIGHTLRRCRVNVWDVKEKYGTLRIYLSFGWSGFHSITHPGHCFSRYPMWLWRLDCSRPVAWLFGALNVIIVPLQQRLYRHLYRAAIARWPHLREEILDCADYPELLENL
jgi:hypothetical protein